MILAGTGYFFSGAITTIIGDFKQIGIALFVIVMVGVIAFYLIERYWLSEKVEEANPETIQKIEEKFHDIEEVAQEKLHDLGERLHLTSQPNKENGEKTSDAEVEVKERKKSATK